VQHDRVHQEAVRPASAARSTMRAGSAPGQAPEPEKVDVVEQLKRFAELRDQGILTEKEFAAQKAKLLDM
jgi:hypothetical protein